MAEPGGRVLEEGTTEIGSRGREDEDNTALVIAVCGDGG